MISYKKLRARHPRFTYESYSYYISGQDLVVQFLFTLSSITFKPTIVIKNVDEKRLRKLRPQILENFIFHLGLAEIPSYWKCSVSPKVIIKAGSLSQAQTAWWHDLLRHGLAEFFYVNDIPFSKDFVTITSAVKSQRLKTTGNLRLKHRYLVPMGGGKDSLVTAEILKAGHLQFQTLILGNVPAAVESSHVVSKNPPIIIERKIDPQLLALNKQGYLNGHTPFSSYLAFLSVLSALLFDYKSIAISQERSSNEGNLRKNGQEINHQYSKSFDFEKKFCHYLAHYLSPEIEYFSLLRPLYELQIAKLFSQNRKYFSAFKSCNVNLKQNSWCGQCPKCFAIYLLLAPFLKEEDLIKIFGRNLLDDPSLWAYLPSFLGRTKSRPFDCIATIKETEVALSLTIKKYEQERKSLPRLLARYKKENPHKKINAQKLLAAWNSQNFVPKKIQKTIRVKI